jgi:exonuclease-1
LKVRQILYVVAPYEADAQLAYLAQNGFVDGVISEDSDCLVFQCGIVLYKWGKHGDGTIEEIQLANIKHNNGDHGMDFRTFTDEMVRSLTAHLCFSLSECFLPSS